MSSHKELIGLQQAVSVKHLILFDGHCNLCNGAVQWVIKRDRKGHFHFAALSWPAGEQVLHKFPELEGVDSIVYFDGKKVYVRSSAALKIAGALGGVWAISGVFWLVPRIVRDGVYNWVARNRYRWFGKMDTCMMPSPELEQRFLRK